MAQPDASGERKYRYKLRLTVEQTEVGRPSILVNRHKLFEVDSTQSPEIHAFADYSRDHSQMPDRDRYILAFSLHTARQILGGASDLSARFKELRACIDGIDQT